MKGQKDITFEKSLEELEDIANKLEKGDLSLDDSIKAFEKGIEHAQFCNNKLEEAERKIEILQKGPTNTVEKNPIKVKKDTGDIEDNEEIQGSLL